MSAYKKLFSSKYIWWIMMCGAMLWFSAGIILSLRPGGHPPYSFRKSADLVPLLALGLVLVGVSFGVKMLAFKKAGGKLFTIACLAVVISSLAYALGVLIRLVFLNATGWEPFMPLGFLVFIISWTILGVLSLKRSFLSRSTGLLMIITALSLLSFNDQHNPYGAVVFGILLFLVILQAKQDYRNSMVPRSPDSVFRKTERLQKKNWRRAVD